MFYTEEYAADFRISSSSDYHKLIETHAITIEKCLGDGWKVYRHFNADGELAMMISAICSPSLDRILCVDAEPTGMALSLLEGERLEHIGCYNSVNELISAIINNAN